MKKTVFANSVRKLIKLQLYIFLYSLLPVMVQAQDDGMVKGFCTPDVVAVSADGSLARGPRHRLPAVNTQWDATRTYRQLVILFTFSDTDFSNEDPHAFYNDLFNTTGYHQRQGAGCVADYFREQSGGLFNLAFDVYGPYKIDAEAQPYENPSEKTVNYGRSQMQAATQLFLAEHADLDFSVYDWNGNGYVNQVIFVYAGYGGNQNSQKCWGHIWPNTSSFDVLTTADNHRISSYSASAELWSNNVSCGIGTICHEFSHSLGLPDIYPVNGWTYSAVDEWDLMDGGNFTNYGWCPPNYSPMEKYLLGWLTPRELTEPTTVSELKSVADGGEVYKICHTDDEYLLLENRQWTGWDAGVPGRGLVIYHVNYVPTAWASNSVNNTNNQFNYHILNADGLDYDAWESLLLERGVTSQSATYQHSDRMNRWFLSSSSYPWSTDSTAFVNDALTDASVPAAKMINANEQGSYYLAKPITNIAVSSDGLVSFDFMGGSSTAVRSMQVADLSPAVYDLNGRRLSSVRGAKGLVIRREADGTVRKMIQ